VIVGIYNKYFITSIVIIAVIVGSYNHYFITSIVVIAEIELPAITVMTIIDVIKK
jgi:hypothetical protein